MKRIIDIPDFRFNQCKENIKTIELFEVLVDAVNDGAPISDNTTNGGQQMIKKMDQEIVNSIMHRKKWEFRPCPFCGSEDIGVGEQTIDVLMNGPDTPCTAIQKIWAECNHCRAHGREKTADIVYPSETVAVAVEGWNQREAADGNDD